MLPASPPLYAARTVALLLALAPLTVQALPADLLPATGPYGSVAAPFAPAVAGAAVAEAVRYHRADGRPLGALLAAVPGPGYEPEAALDAVVGGAPGAARPVLLRGHPLALVTVARAGGAPAYAVGFAVTLGADRVLLDPVSGDVHVVAWSDSEEGAVALAAAALDHLAAAPVVSGTEVAPVSALAASPNPALAAVALHFALSAPAEVRVAVYDVRGRRVATLTPGRMGTGTHALSLETAPLAPGVYVARLTAGAGAATLRFTRR